MKPHRGRSLVPWWRRPRSCWRRTDCADVQAVTATVVVAMSKDAVVEGACGSCDAQGPRATECAARIVDAFKLERPDDRRKKASTREA